jgi:hypothetical protein
MKFSFSFFIIFALIFKSLVYAQNPERELGIKKSKVPIKLDGILEEEAWQHAAEAGNFKLILPFDTAFAKHQTVVKMSFDDKFLYVGAVIYQDRNKYTISSLKRDFAGGSGDVFTINIDTFKDKLNGIQFALSPLNVQREGLISLGVETDNSWDNKWYSEVKNYDDKWVAEIAIPFTTLRYKVSENYNSWRINFARNYLKSNELSSWYPVPRNFPPASLAFTGLLIWEDAPPKPGANISLIPYLSANTSKEISRNEQLEPIMTNRNNGINVGMDAKVAITPSLNLDLTVNPDFSQVEVDQQQTNLSRFELFFPEKRQFFIENSDLFGTFGFPNTRPFFSRRIGITRNAVTGLAQQVPIIAGARLSGKLNDDWRIGLMNMQTKKVDFGANEFLPATNYAVGVLQRKLFTRSSIGAIVVNKENFLDKLPANTQEKYKQFNRVAGLEFNYYSPNNRIEIETYFHQSFSPIQQNDAASIAHYMGYNHPNIELNLGLMRIGKNYQAEMGFVPRNGIYQVFRPFSFTLNPKNQKIASKIVAYGVGMDGNDVFDLKGKRLDSETVPYLFLNTPANASISAGYYMAFTHLFFPFDPTNSADNPDPDFAKRGIPLEEGDYRYQTVFIEFSTPQRNSFFGNVLAYSGRYFNGYTSVVNSSMTYRLQPIGTFSLDLNYTNIRLPSPHNSVKYILLGPKAELAFSKSLFLSTFYQYNSQTNNTNINTRLQWRFKPVSDLFLVYTDNYFAQEISKYRIQPWTPKNRALILKITYWLNV